MATTGTVQDWIDNLSDYGLGDDISPDDLLSEVNKVIQDVNSRQTWPYLETTANVTLTAGQALVTAPARLNKVRGLVIDSIGQVLVPERRETIVKKYVGGLTNQGVPFHYYFIGQSMYVYPIPQQSYTAILDYTQDEITVDATTPLASLLLPQKHHAAYFLGLLASLYAMEDDTEMYGLYQSRFEQKIVNMMDDLAMHQLDMPDRVVDVWDDGYGWG